MITYGLCCLELNAQQYQFEIIGLEEGLPSLAVNQIVEGPQGFYWLATEGAGLVRYDGYDFESFKNEEQPVINFISLSESGHLWYTTEGELSRYDGFEFTNYSLPADFQLAGLLFLNNTPTIVARDGRVSVLAGDSLKPASFQLPENWRSWHIINETLFVGSDSGLFKLEKGYFDLLDSNAVRNLTGTADLWVKGADMIWENLETGARLDGRGFNLNVFGENKVLWKADSVIVKTSQGEITLSSSSGLPAEQVSSVFWASDGTLILVTERGLVKFPGIQLQYFSKPGKQVYALGAYQNSILLGTAEGAHFLNHSQNNDLTKLGLILAFAEINQRLYLGSERGLFVYENQKIKSIPLAVNDFVFSLKAQGDTLWIGTGSGIYRYYNGKVTNMTQQVGLPTATIFSIKEAPDGSLWFASYTRGFFRYHEGEWKQVTRLGNYEFQRLRFSCFLPLSKDQMWLGTQNNGLYHLRETGETHYTFSDLNYAEILALERVNSCNEDESPQVWLGTNKGLVSLLDVRLRKSQGGRNSLPFVGGATSANALFFQEGTLWQGTESGVYRLDVCDFIKAQSELQVAISTVSLFMGNKPGLTRFAEDSLAFSGVPVKPELPYNRNYLTFSCTVRSLYRPREIQYRYRLKGQENLWTYAGSRREAIFTELKPGKYVFEVEARRPGNPWQGEILSYPFSIKTPYWKTWWFITLLVVVVGSVTSILVRDRVKRLNQRLKLENELLEMERKALRLQMNPHFIFNALDSISSFIFKKDPRQAVRYLNNFAKLMRLTLESSMEHLHPVETEVSILKNYLELEKLRFGDKFDFAIELDDEIDYDVGLPPMLVQPHVENAILHGLKPKEGKGFLKISFLLKGDILCVTIEDDGIGRKKAKELPNRKGHRSMATQINKDRLRLLRSSLSDKVNLTITDKYNDDGEATGTIVNIKLPAENI